VLIGHLERHTTTEGLADDRGALDTEDTEQVSHRARVRTERVIADRLGRLAMAQHVGGDDAVAIGEAGHHLAPCF
jgi:hypothetical protein